MIAARQIQPVPTVLRHAIPVSILASQVPNSATPATLTPQVVEFTTVTIVYPAPCQVLARTVAALPCIADTTRCVITVLAASNVYRALAARSV